MDSDGTAVIFFSELSGGTEQTMLDCIRYRKPYELIDAHEVPAPRAAELIARFVTEHTIGILNVAGPRASGAPEAHNYARDVIHRLLAASDSDLKKRPDIDD